MATKGDPIKVEVTIPMKGESVTRVMLDDVERNDIDIGYIHLPVYTSPFFKGRVAVETSFPKGMWKVTLCPVCNRLLIVETVLCPHCYAYLIWENS